ncbi:MAG: adenylate/guanylate cyclase domain-containing protein, partial [Anaerolineae bacterium]|nr:adenylate/guanylate cyclase domain-containing protein [Anaerolineae bacterium]
RADFTVIGRPANLGARICSVANAGEVLISQETYALVKDHVVATPRPGQQFKGVAGNVVVYHVTDLR